MVNSLKENKSNFSIYSPKNLNNLLNFKSQDSENFLKKHIFE